MSHFAFRVLEFYSKSGKDGFDRMCGESNLTGVVGACIGSSKAALPLYTTEVQPFILPICLFRNIPLLSLH